MAGRCVGGRSAAVVVGASATPVFRMRSDYKGTRSIARPRPRWSLAARSTAQHLVWRRHRRIERHVEGVRRRGRLPGADRPPRAEHVGADGGDRPVAAEAGRRFAQSLRIEDLSDDDIARSSRASSRSRASREWGGPPSTTVSPTTPPPSSPRGLGQGVLAWRASRVSDIRDARTGLAEQRASRATSLSGSASRAGWRCSGSAVIAPQIPFAWSRFRPLGRAGFTRTEDASENGASRATTRGDETTTEDEADGGGGSGDGTGLRATWRRQSVACWVATVRSPTARVRSLRVRLDGGADLFGGALGLMRSSVRRRWPAWWLGLRRWPWWAWGCPPVLLRS